MLDKIGYNRRMTKAEKQDADIAALRASLREESAERDKALLEALIAEDKADPDASAREWDQLRGASMPTKEAKRTGR